MTTYEITAAEYVEINGVPMNTPAWTHSNLWEFWSGPAVRGSDVVIPYAEGVRPYRRIVDARKITMELAIVGDFDWTGASVADARAGLWANVAHLRANVTDPPLSGDGTMPVTLHAPDGTEWTGDVIVEKFELGALGDWGAAATIDLVLVQGQLTVVGSI